MSFTWWVCIITQSHRDLWHHKEYREWAKRFAIFNTCTPFSTKHCVCVSNSAFSLFSPILRLIWLTCITRQICVHSIIWWHLGITFWLISHLVCVNSQRHSLLPGLIMLYTALVRPWLTPPRPLLFFFRIIRRNVVLIISFTVTKYCDAGKDQNTFTTVIRKCEV